jgi:hypothetical protein
MEGFVMVLVDVELAEVPLIDRLELVDEAVELKKQNMLILSLHMLQG